VASIDSATVVLTMIAVKNHYTKSHQQINPFSITPLGPEPPILPLDEEVPAVQAALKK
jgi:glutathionyl-hydroquinone reductase